MKKAKKLFLRQLALVMAFVMLISMLPVRSLAASEVASGTCGDDLTWNLSDDGVLTISGTGGMNDYDYYYNNEFAPWLGDYSNEITTIVIEDGVTSIGNYAFWYCDSLIHVTIPDSVTSIGTRAFSYCDSLIHVTIPDSVTGIGECAFLECTNLEEVDLGNGVEGIGFGCFAGCESLKEVKIPASVTLISYGDNSRGTSQFIGCDSLEGIYVDKNNQRYFSDDFGVLYGYNGYLWEAPKQIGGEYIVPDGVNVIWEAAFYCCTKLERVTIPESVTNIEIFAFYGCSNLSEVIFLGDAPCFGDRYSGSVNDNVFEGATATAYYPAGNATWTEDVLQNYGGTITWVPYEAGETPWEDAGEMPGGDGETGTTPEVDTHDTIEELTDVDYMLFSELAYKDLSSALGDPTANPVKEPKTIKEFYADKWDKKWKTYDLTYGEVFGTIANWYPTSIHSKEVGYTDIVFSNESGDVVIAYKGSDNLVKGLMLQPDPFSDWFINDFPAEVLDIGLPQIDSALSTYTMIEGMVGASRIAVTGHSLGGALADVVSAYSGCKGVSFNAISALDVAYVTNPTYMAKNFEGVDRWNFIDHANEYDCLAGTYEETFYSTRIKPYIAHQSLCGKEDLSDLADNHSMTSFLTDNSSGALALTIETGRYSSNNAIECLVSPLLFGKTLQLGTSRNDYFGSLLAEKEPSFSFGGNGYDQLFATDKDDYLIGGNGKDLLDGGWGNDTYVYYKGDGLDYIYDIGGRDKLYLLGFDNDDVIEVAEQDYLYISCNGERIIAIQTDGREYDWTTTDSFTVLIQKENGSTEKFDITNYFKPNVYKSRILVGCPVNVEILDFKGNVVFTLIDGEVGAWYTEYGYFYVFEEENGEYGKVLDLVEGYTARIVGVGDGTMDISYQVPEGGELTDPVTLTSVPVADSLIGTIVEDENDNVYLLVDEDGDGNTDKTIPFDGQHIHDYEAVVTVPTCTEGGYTTYICACGDTYVAGEVEALGHADTDNDNKCDACGTELGVTPDDSTENNPETGDNREPVAWVMLILVSVIGMAATIIFKKKQSVA